MTIDQAKRKLTAYRQEQNQLRRKIDELRNFLRQHNIDPDVPMVDLTERNKSIYKKRLQGWSCMEIGEEFKLSPERIRSICKRFELQRQKRATIKK